MKKKIFSSLLFGALAFATLGTVVSCKDYDDDISGLSSRIDELEKTVDAIEAQVTAGAVITNVESTSNGVKVTLSNNKTFELKNGNDGTPGTAWTIGDDGYWCKDGVATTYYALGTKGDKGDKGDAGDAGTPGNNGTDGAYYVPNADGYFHKVTADGTDTATEIKWKETAAESNQLYATLDEENLKLYNVPDADGKVRTEPIVISRTGALTGLVFAGDALKNGEVVRTLVSGTSLPGIFVASFNTEEKTWNNASGTTTKDTNSEKLSNADKDGKATTDNNKYVKIKTDKENVTTSAVYYHVNPSNVKEKDLQTLTAYVKSDVTSRTASSNFKVEKVAFKEINDGIATFEITTSGSPASLKQTTEDKTQALTMFALQATNSKSEVITSDYAVISGTTLDFGKDMIANDEGDAYPNGTEGSAKVDNTQRNEYKKELAYNKAEGIELSKVVTLSDETKSAAELGLKFVYSVVKNDYVLDPKNAEKKIDLSSFITVSEDGVVKPADITNTAAINQTPLVRVECKYGDKIVAAAYVPVKITGANSYNITAFASGKWSDEIGGFRCVASETTNKKLQMSITIPGTSIKDKGDGSLAQLKDVTEEYEFAIDKLAGYDKEEAWLETTIGGKLVRLTVDKGILKAANGTKDSKTGKIDYETTPYELATISGGVITLANNDKAYALLNTNDLTLPVKITGKETIAGGTTTPTITVNGKDYFNVKFECPIKVAVANTGSLVYSKKQDKTAGENVYYVNLAKQITVTGASGQTLKMQDASTAGDFVPNSLKGIDAYTLSVEVAKSAENNYFSTQVLLDAKNKSVSNFGCLIFDPSNNQSTAIEKDVTVEIPVTVTYALGTVKTTIKVTLKP